MQQLSDICRKLGPMMALGGVTGFDFDGGVSGEDSFLTHMDAVDLHHGQHSFPANPYTALEVVGISLRPGIRALLVDIGFNQFTETENGFAAYRSVRNS